MAGQAPQRLIEWLRGYVYVDRAGKLPLGLKLQYHSRSDAHSIRLCELIVEDLMANCAPLAEQAREGRLVYGINFAWTWPNGKSKTIDLAIGTPALHTRSLVQDHIRRVWKAGEMSQLLIACEAKTTATEHHKSQPRIFSELNDAHMIVHEGDRWAIAAGVELLNISETFVSPLRQRPSQPVAITYHNQPAAAANMVKHLRGLPRRRSLDENGLEAMGVIVVDMDNQAHVELWAEPPAPQPGDMDHYDSFLMDICRTYEERFSDLQNLPEPGGLSVEESLRALGRRHPGLLTRAGEAMVAESRPGAEELLGVLQPLDAAQPPPVEE